MALGFGKLGAQVIVSDIKQESIDAVVNEIKSAGGNALVFQETFPMKWMQLTSCQKQSQRLAL